MTKRTSHDPLDVSAKSSRFSESAIFDKEVFTRVKDDISSLFSDNKPFNTADGIGFRKPFKCCLLWNAARVQQPLAGHTRKENDLYGFSQTKDLEDIGKSDINVRVFRTAISNFVLPWMREATGIPLTEATATASKYEPGDVLLCHDDELSHRRIAYVIYLTQDWKSIDGGSLQLFTMDANGDPTDYIKTIRPEFRSIAFFEVSDISFHHVAEVLKGVRHSVNGWFHGPAIARKPAVPDPEPAWLSPGDIDEQLFFAWVNLNYVIPANQKEARATFEAKSEIMLEDFLHDGMYSRLLEKLAQIGRPETHLKRLGPANKRNNFTFKNEGPDEVRQLQRVMQSDAMCVLLTQLTGLTLFDLEDEDACTKIDTDTRFFGSGCYTLCKDTDYSCDALEARLFAFDSCGVLPQVIHNLESGVVDHVAARYEKTKAVLTSKSPKRTGDGSQEATPSVDLSDGELDWRAYGGYIVYLEKNEPDPLLVVYPRPNCLSLVYREEGVLSYNKYISVATEPHNTYWEVVCRYKDNSPDESEPDE